MTKEPTLFLKIQTVSRGGAGVARDAAGCVYFVPYTAPGDEIEGEIVKREKNYVQMQLKAIHQPSPLRVIPRCPVFSICGGCDWQHLPAAFQWDVKKQGVQHALKRVVPPQVLESEVEWEESPATTLWNYRNRVQLRGRGLALGFYRARSQELVPITQCDLAHPELAKAFEGTRQEGARRFGPVQPYKVELEWRDGEVRRFWNQPHAAGGFRQVNEEANAKLQRWLQAQFESLWPLTGDKKPRLLDLFGGSGNFAKVLLPWVKEAHTVDAWIPPEVREAEAQEPPSSKKHFFHVAEAVSWIREWKPVGGLEGVGVADPPRQGLSRGALTAWVRNFKTLQVKTLFWIGCDPDAWARGVSVFCAAGWSLRKVHLFDFFPQTHHVESVALLVAPENE